jgi:uncharacterized RDD family membrane protein YckC
VSDAAAPAAGPAVSSAPGLARRLACFLYEGVLLFGIVMIAGLAYSVVTDQRHALQGAPGMRLFLFVVLGLYFVYFWSRRGQTLAMQTWHIRLVTRDGRVPRWPRALARYVLAWLWFVPALALLHLAGLKGGLATSVVVLVGVLAYAAMTRLHPERQYWHDAVCGTRLVDWRPPPRR